MVYQASQNVSLEKNLKVQKEEESAKPKQVETKKPSAFSPPIPSSSQRPSSVILNFFPGDNQLKGETDDEKISVEELRTQINDLMSLVDALKKEHGRELEKLKKDLEEEKLLRSNLELNTLHQNDIPIMCRVMGMGDNDIYRYIHLIKELKTTTSGSQSNALLLEYYGLERREEGHSFEDIPQFKFLKAVCYADLFTGAVK
ncbi:hypothetical protein Q9233_014738 [Columba guinea]|nr:hypothetical protein Q9233_014738 [Columba guinea]